MSRQTRLAAALTLAVALVAAAFSSVGGAAAADPVDPALEHARAQLAWCQDARAQARTAAERNWANTCIALAQRVVDARTPTPGPTVTPTPTATTAPPTSAPPPTSEPPPSTPAAGFPNAATTGVPAGWVPTSTRTSFTVTTAGAVIEDVRVNGTITVDAPNVTLRRVEIVGGVVNNVPVQSCRNGLLLEDVSIIRAPGQTTRSTDLPAVQHGGYTARRVKIDGKPEGFRVGGKSAFGCGPVVIADSFVHVVRPDVCSDWHGDGIQGYDGNAVTVRNTTLHLDEQGCGGTAPFFYPHSQGNTSATVDGLLVRGGGFVFRDGMPGSVRGLRIVEGWGYGPIDVRCSVLTEWEAAVVRVDAAYRITETLRALPCNTNGGG